VLKLLRAEQAVLPCMGIQPCHRNAGLFISRLPKRFIGQTDDGEHPLLGTGVTRLSKRYMGGDMDGFQLLTPRSMA
jgi:hypothetical protein